MRWSGPPFVFSTVVFADGLHKQALDLRQGEGFFRKSIKLGFAQNLCQRGHALHSGSTSDQPVRPFPAITFLVVASAVFNLLLFVPELGKLAFIGGDLGFQFGDRFMFFQNT